MIEDKYLTAYFGRQSDYYVEKYKLYKSGSSITFNTGAFFAGLFWFLYRKLWTESAVLLLAIYGIGAIEDYVFLRYNINADAQTSLYMVYNLLFASLFGFVGNYFYLKKSERNISKVLVTTEDEPERINNLKKVGGTSWAPFFFLLFIILLVVTYIAILDL